MINSPFYPVRMWGVRPRPPPLTLIFAFEILRLFHFKSKSRAAGEGARPTLFHAEELFHLLEVGGSAIGRQAFHKHFSVLLLQNTVVQQHQQSTIM